VSWSCKHDWQPFPRASTPSVMLPGELLPQRCASCGTRYPCAKICEHLDCQAERDARAEADALVARLSDDSIRGPVPDGRYLFDEEGS
jgi:hypothetical protein